MNMTVDNTVLSIPTTRSFSRFSPLRYPGGKASLGLFFERLLDDLALPNPIYVEPYAGGAGAGIALLLEGRISQLVINDLDPAIFAFWKSILTDTDAFLDRIRNTPLTVPEWRRQKEIYQTRGLESMLDLGFAFFYLNRTNRSGILKAGIIGGLKQTGNYRMDARFNKEHLASRIRAISAMKDRIRVTRVDGRQVVQQYSGVRNSFMYIDPPYVQAGDSLYMNSFDYQDHYNLAMILHREMAASWLLTYDDDLSIHQLYDDLGTYQYRLHYSAGSARNDMELLIASPAVQQKLRAYDSSLDLKKAG